MYRILLALLGLTTAGYAATRTIDADFIRSTDRTKTWTPPAATDTLVGRTSTDTLTNKTLTSPVFSGMTSGSIPYFNSSLQLAQANSSMFYDATNNRVGLFTSSPSYGFQFNITADDYSRGMLICHSLSGAGVTNSCYRLYTDYTNNVFSIANPNQTTVSFATDHLGRISLSGGNYTLGGAVNIANQTGRTSDHTLMLKKLSSQTGDAIRVVDTDGSTVLAKIDIAGKAFLTGIRNLAFSAVGVVTTDANGDLSSVAPGTSGNVLTSNGSAWTSAAPSGGSTIRDYVIVDSGNGHGSTNTKIRRFSNNRASAGTTITYADSATNGGSFTVGSDGIYAISYSDVYGTGNESFGITVNDSAMTTNISNPLTYAQGMRIIARGEPNGGAVALSWTGFLSNGDVVRAHTNGNANATGASCMFTIIKIAN